ncbi:hypothetical protein [Nitrosomonas nitrosa]|uniref:Uncharacterized protein n=1 Tax=Nitrosomonas nitrosa TaxID=52442 RepID=A0A1I4MG47_9PROT|nr:hypothetical protein [Nitrosomonas nitrosa]MCO6433026.1 hypothetical protein [Nitrosomonas nitrosa]SFM02402.1 hypothetical protein SAMN05421880_10483 [Nitrosomonas nitrosa]
MVIKDSSAGIDIWVADTGTWEVVTGISGVVIDTSVGGIVTSVADINTSMVAMVISVEIIDTLVAEIGILAADTSTMGVVIEAVIIADQRQFDFSSYKALFLAATWLIGRSWV